MWFSVWTLWVVKISQTKLFKPLSLHEHTHQMQTYCERKKSWDGTYNQWLYEWITKVFVEQPLASPRSAKYSLKLLGANEDLLFKYWYLNAVSCFRDSHSQRTCPFLCYIVCMYACILNKIKKKQTNKKKAKLKIQKNRVTHKGLSTLRFLPSKWDYLENSSFISAQDFVKVV